METMFPGAPTPYPVFCTPARFIAGSGNRSPAKRVFCTSSIRGEKVEDCVKMLTSLIKKGSKVNR